MSNGPAIMYIHHNEPAQILYNSHDKIPESNTMPNKPYEYGTTTITIDEVKSALDCLNKLYQAMLSGELVRK